MKGKFKIGDKTRIIDSGKTCNTYRDFFDENGIGKKISQKYAYGVTFSDGEIVTILAVEKHRFSSYPDPYYVIERNDGKVSLINEIGLELVESVADEITINLYGNKVVAEMGKKVGVARCNETDTFNLYMGVKIAVDRLFGKDKEVKEEKPKYYNGKVVCVDNRIDDNNFKKGRIYEVVNGTVNGFPLFHKKLTDFKDLQYYFSLSGNYSAYEVKFIELVEGGN